jgi:hypothetical protein
MVTSRPSLPNSSPLSGSNAGLATAGAGNGSYVTAKTWNKTFVVFLKNDTSFADVELFAVYVVGEVVPDAVKPVGVIGCPVFQVITTEVILLPSGTETLNPDVLAV